MDLSPDDAKFLRELQHRMLREAIIEQQTGMSAIDPLRYKRASSPLVDDNSNADKTRPPHWLHFSLAQWCDAAYEENRMNENKIKRLEQLLQARQREFATKWGRAALPHERLTYFPLEDLIKNNGKKIRSDKKHFLECNEDK